MTNEAAQQLAKLRWKGTTEKQRSKMVPHNGGRPRTYPVCPRYNNKAHRFTDDRCPCGYQRKTTKKGEHKHGTLKH